MLANQNKRKLKAIANQESKTILKINIGKDLFDENVINSIKNAFNTRELLKVCFLKAALDSKEKEELILDLMGRLYGVEVVSLVGNTLLLYKKNKKLKDHIVF